MDKPITLSSFFRRLLAILALLCVFPALAVARPDTPEPSAAKPEPRTFAVSGFPVIGARSTDYSWLGVGLGDDLATRLARCDQHLFQVERLQFNEVLRAQRVEMLTQGVSEAAEPDAAEREQLMGLAQAARTSFQGQKWGARYVIVGSLWLEGTYPQEQARLKANVRLVDVATGQIVGGAQAASEGSEAGYVRLQEQLAEQLAERLGVPAEQQVQVRDYQIEKDEVYRLFAQARAALYQGRYQEAKNLSSQAKVKASPLLFDFWQQIQETETQAHERLVAQLEREEADRVSGEYEEKGQEYLEKYEEASAYLKFDMGERKRIGAEIKEWKGIPEAARRKYQEALRYYDDYLRNTPTQKLLWEMEVGNKSEDIRIDIEDGLIYLQLEEKKFNVINSRLQVFDIYSHNLLLSINSENNIQWLTENKVLYVVTDNNILQAFQASTGKKLWEFQVGMLLKIKWFLRISRPNIKLLNVINGVAIVSVDSQILAFDFRNDELFSRVVDGVKYLRSPQYGYLQELNIAINNVVFNVYGGTIYNGVDYQKRGSHFSALDIRTGQLLWDTEDAKHLLVKNDIAYVMSYDHHLMAFDAKSGTLLWKKKTSEAPPEVKKTIKDDLDLCAETTANYSSYKRSFFDCSSSSTEFQEMTAEDGIVYIKSITSLPKHDEFSLHQCHSRLQAFDGRSGKLFLNFEIQECIDKLIVENGVAYALSESKYHLWVFETRLGKLLWEDKKKNKISLATFGNTAYAGSDDGFFRVFEARTGVLLRELQLEGKITNLHALSNNMIILTIDPHTGMKYNENDRKRLLAINPTANLNVDFARHQKAFVLNKLGEKDQALRVLSQLIRENINQPLDYYQQWIGLLEGKNLPCFINLQVEELKGQRDTASENALFQWNSNKFCPPFLRVEAHSDDPSEKSELPADKVADDIAYNGYSDGYLRAFDTRDGTLLWEFKAKGDMQYLRSVVVDGVIYIASEDHYLRAFEARKGTLLWEIEGKEQSYRPLLVNGVAYVTSDDGHIRAFQSQTGKLLWDIQSTWIRGLSIAANGVLYFIDIRRGDYHLWAFDISPISSSRYPSEIMWGSQEQFFSYLLWDKAGLAARQILEGYDLESVLSQSHLTPDQLAEGLDRLANGKPYDGLGALAEDPKDLCPPWYNTICARPDHTTLRPAVAFYLDRAASSEKDRAAYLAEAKRLAPDVDLTPWGLE